VSVTRALIVQPNGTGEVDVIVAKLDQFNVIVGGYIEGVTLETCHLYCNEEGKMMGLPVNVAATMLAHRLGWPRGDALCGPVVFLGNDPAGGEADVPQAVLDAFAEVVTRRQ
jgi:hypothetical protein